MNLLQLQQRGKGLVHMLCCNIGWGGGKVNKIYMTVNITD